MPNYYEITFKKASEQDDTAFRLPINPDKLPIERGSENEDYNVLGIGPIMQARTPSLRTVSISSYFPGRVDLLTLTPNNFKEPQFYIEFFENAMLNKEILVYLPVRAYETGEPYMIQDVEGFDVLVTGFSYEERGGETGDFYYNLELTEYKDYSPLKIVIEETQEGTMAATTEATRTIPKGQLYIGGAVKVNGPYYYSSYGDEPHGEGNGKTCLISRIVTDDSTRPYPIHIMTENGGALGWIKESSCQAVSE
jgi:hypothetical protein